MYEFKYMDIKQIRASHINDTPGSDSFVGGGFVGLLLHKKLHLTHFPLSDSAKQLNRESNTNHECYGFLSQPSDANQQETKLCFY